MKTYLQFFQHIVQIAEGKKKDKNKMPPEMVVIDAGKPNSKKRDKAIRDMMKKYHGTENIENAIKQRSKAAKRANPETGTPGTPDTH